MTKENGSAINIRYYFSDGYEKDVTGPSTKYVQYINSPVGLIATVVSEGTSHTPYYTYTDHLGSILTVTCFLVGNARFILRTVTSLI